MCYIGNPYCCAICKKELNDKTEHLHIHPAKHKCEICEKQFNQSGNLKVHIIIHTGETPYEYAVCGKKYSQNSSLKVQSETSHKCISNNSLKNTLS